MRFYVAWCLAEEADAAAIRTTVTTNEHKLDEWVHLLVTGVDAPEVNKLERLVRPRQKGKRMVTGGQMLVRGKLSDARFTCVSRVAPEFLDALVSLPGPRISEVAAKWTEGVLDGEAVALEKLIRDMAAFAGQSQLVGKPVLQLDIM